MKLRFRTKLFATFLLVSVLLSGVIILIVYDELIGVPTSVSRRLLLSAVANAARSMEAEDVTELTRRYRVARQEASREQPDVPFTETDASRWLQNDPLYRKLHDTFRQIDRLPPHFGKREGENRHDRYVTNDRGFEKDIYILIPTDRPDRVAVLAAIHPPDAGMTYDMNDYPEMREAWEKPAAEQAITWDLSTRSLGAWAPIRDEQGRAVALLGMDAPGRAIEDIQHYLVMILLVIFAVAVVLSLLPAMYISWRINRPIHRLHEGMHRVAQGRNDAAVDVMQTGDELESLMRQFNEMVAGLAERDKLKRSLELAKQIQQHLLPIGGPNLPGFDIHGSILYCDETGGDYYDFLEVLPYPSNSLGLAVGDVTGHGIAAALLMTSTRAVLRSHAGRYRGDLAKLFADINRQLVRDTGDERFVTMFFGLVDAERRELRYVSAGHDPALLIRADTREVQWLGNTGIPLGILEDAPYAEAGPFDMNPGDLLVLSTDGIREARDPSGEEFGEQRLRQVVLDNLGRPAREIHEAIVRAVRRHQADQPQEDDITLVVLRCVDESPGGN
jgi:serine phosphatase RsbU (regulator of sigma subunit)